MTKANFLNKEKSAELKFLFLKIQETCKDRCHHKHNYKQLVNARTCVNMRHLQLAENSSVGCLRSLASAVDLDVLTLCGIVCLEVTKSSFHLLTGKPKFVSMF